MVGGVRHLLRGIVAVLLGIAGGEADTESEVRRKAQINVVSRLSYEEFSQGYLVPNKPVIITDGLKGWSAIGRWTPDFFKQRFGEMVFTLSDDLRAKAGGEKELQPVQYSMSEIIDRVIVSTADNPAPYLRNQVIADLFPSLQNDIEPLPAYFFPNWLPEHFLVKQIGNVLNRGAAIELYIGGRGAGFPVLHYDGAATHAFLMQIYGRKEFVLYEPQQERYLYPSPQKPNLSLVNSVDNPDLERFPLFNKARATRFVLEPGQMVFIPSRWWHTTKMLTASISVSVNVGNHSNWAALTDYVSQRAPNRWKAAASRLYLTATGARRAFRDRHKANERKREFV